MTSIKFDRIMRDWANWTIASVLFLCCIVLALVAAPMSYAIPDPDPAPSGGEPRWEEMAYDCEDGVMASCDRLADETRYVDAPVYHDYGFSCGGRVNYTASADEDTYVTCVSQYG